MKVAILGGTGILSTDFTKKLIESREDVYLINRGNKNIFVEEKNITTIVLDIKNDSLNEIKEKIKQFEFDVVVDFLSFTINDLKKHISVFENRCSQYVFISSATAYIKKAENDKISEELNRVGNEKWEYSYNKYKCEEYIKIAGIPYTIIRPYITYGETRIPFQLIPNGYYYTLIKRIEDKKPVVLFNNGVAITTLTSTVDFANVLYKVLLNPKCINQDFHITSNFCYSWRDVYDEIVKQLQGVSNIISIDAQEAKMMLPEYYESLIGDKGTSFVFDNTKILNAIGGYDFQVDLKEGLRSSLSYFSLNKDAQIIDSRWDASIDYVCRRKGYKGKLSPVCKEKLTNKEKFNYFIFYHRFTRSIFYALRKIRKHI